MLAELRTDQRGVALLRGYFIRSREPGSTSHSPHGIGDLFSALKR